MICACASASSGLSSRLPLRSISVTTGLLDVKMEGSARACLAAPASATIRQWVTMSADHLDFEMQNPS